MNKTIFVLFLALAISTQVSPLSKDSFQDFISTSANYGLAERFSAHRLERMLYSTHVTPMWFTNSDKFVYQYKTSQGEKLFLVDPSLGKKKEILDMDQLAMQLTEIIKDPFDGQQVKVENLDLKEDRYLMFSITSSQDRVFANDSSEVAMRKRGSKQIFFFQYDINSQKLEDVTEEEQDKDLMYPYYAVMSPDGTRGIYVKGHNLYMMDAENLQKAALSETDTTLVEVRLIEDGSHDFCWGVDNYKGDISTDKKQRIRPSTVVWSPDSKTFQKQPENQNKAYADYYRSLAKAGDSAYEAYAEYYEKLAEEAVETVDYKVGTNQELAKNLQGHLLLVHGDMDDNVSMSHSLRVVDALIKNHKRFDMLVLPGQRHWFGDMDEYFFWRLADYFCEWLKGDSKRGEVNIKEMNNDL